MIRSYNRWDKHEAEPQKVDPRLSSCPPQILLHIWTKSTLQLGLLIAFHSVHEAQLHLWCLKMVSPCLFCPSCLHEVSVGGVQEGREEISL